MSRLGKRPIPVPKGVEVSISKDGLIRVKGPKGERSLSICEGLTLKVEETELLLVQNNSKGADFGLYRSLIQNLVLGVASGFEKKLSLVGVGFRAAVSGNKLDLQVGFSHPTALEIPKEIEVKVEKSTSITISGIDKQKVGQFAAQVRSLRPPEPYKGKGIRYQDEYVRKKAGKAAAKSK